MRLVSKGLMQNRKINVSRKDVLAKIKANYENHKKMYAESYAGYLIEAGFELDKKEEQFKKALADARAVVKATREAPAPAEGEEVTPPVIYLNFSGGLSLHPPVDHSEDYEVVIQMLEMSVDDVIEMEVSEVEMFCMDRWEWSDQFHAVNKTYSMSLGKAARK